MTTPVLTPREQIQIYVNEFIGHTIINRGLLRLYDNDLVVYAAAIDELATVSGILNNSILVLDTRVTTNENDITALQAAVGTDTGSSTRWNSAYSTLQTTSGNWETAWDSVENGGKIRWDSVYSSVNATSAIWNAGGGGGGDNTLSALLDTDANPAFLSNDDQLKWSSASNKWIAYTPSVGSYTTASEVSGIVETYDFDNNWTAHGNNTITDRKHLTDDWNNALINASTPKDVNPVATANDLTPLYSVNNFIRFVDAKSSGVDGGTFTLGARRQRDINHEINNTVNGASLGTNEYNIPSGSYYAEIDCEVGGSVGPHKAWLYDSTGAADLLSGSVSKDLNTAKIKGIFNVSVPSTIRVQHQCTNTVTNTGFGEATSFGDSEIYLDARIWKFEEAVSTS